jgi:diguanylate cyclase (GGDEF)-like protein
MELIPQEAMGYRERRQKLLASVQYRDLVLTVATAIYVLLVQLDFVAFKPPFLLAVAGLLLWNRGAAFFYHREWRPTLVAWVSGVLDIAVCAVLIHQTGGLRSILLPVYFIVVVGAAGHLDARFGGTLLVLAGLSVSALALPDALHLPAVPPLGARGGLSEPMSDPRYRIIVIASLIAFLIPVLYSSSLLSTKLRVREHELERANTNLNALYEIGRALLDTLSTDRVTETIVRGVRDAFGMSRVELFLRGSDGHLLSVMRAPDGTPVHDPVDEISRWEHLRARQEELGPVQDGRLIYLPIGTQARVLGLLVAEQLPPGRLLDREEMTSIKALAGQAGIAVENARLYEATEQLSRTDGLTQLYNHRFFQERIQEEIKRSDRFRQKLSLMMIDVDDFKRVNDTHGHLVGDRVLREIARVLRGCLREVDVAARYGGDEFAIILPDTDLHQAVEVSERLRRAVNGHDFLHGPSPSRLTLSVGVATRAPMSPLSSEGLLKAADEALFRAKREGRNSVAAYPPA